MPTETFSHCKNRRLRSFNLHEHISQSRTMVRCTAMYCDAMRCDAAACVFQVRSNDQRRGSKRVKDGAINHETRTGSVLSAFPLVRVSGGPAWRHCLLRAIQRRVSLAWYAYCLPIQTVHLHGSGSRHSGHAMRQNKAKTSQDSPVFIKYSVRRCREDEKFASVALNVLDAPTSGSSRTSNLRAFYLGYLHAVNGL
jgi:hypothetical protein